MGIPGVHKIKFKTDDGAEFDSYNFEYLERFTYRNESGNVVIVNNSRKVMELVFTNDNMYPSSLKYYYEFDGKLFVENYDCSGLRLCMKDRNQIKTKELKGRSRFWLKPETHRKDITIVSRSIEGYTPTSDMCTCSKDSLKN